MGCRTLKLLRSVLIEFGRANKISESLATDEWHKINMGRRAQQS